MAIGKEDGSIILKTKIDESGIKTGFTKIKGLAKAASKSVAIVGAAALAASVAVTKMAVSAYAEFEQLAGGTELMFGEASKSVMKNAKEAYKTVQMSQNEYLSQVNGFATGLKSALGRNEQAAADLAHRIIVAEADIVAATGETQENIQNAFNGIMKSNFTMLDNLKLGITPTKEGFQEVIDKVNAWNETNGKATNYQMDNLADMQSAIVDYVEMQGMSGYATKEAAKTIQGSLAMTKASWENLLIAMSSGQGLDEAIDGFVYSIDKLSANLTPVIERTLLGLGQALQKTLPKLVQTVVTALVQEIPNLVVAVYNMIMGLFKGILLGIKALFAGETAKATESIVENIESSSDGAKAISENMKKAAKETQKAGKEAKKSLASFDDLSILSSSANATENSPEINVPDVDIGGDSSGGITGTLTDEILGKSQEIDAELTAIMAIAGEALIAIGLLLLFFGQVPYGIGFIITGAITFGVAASNSEKGNVAQDVVGMLTTIMGVAGGALLALGIILLWLGGVVGTGVAIGMIVAGAALIVSAVATKAAFSPDDIGGWLSLIMGIAGGALLALGIILCMVGSVPLGVGLIIAGAVSLVSAFALNSDAVVEAIQGPLGVILAIAGSALLVLGIILTCTGMLPLGIALIAAGAVSLATPVVLNWNLIVDKTKEMFKNFGGIIAAAGVALIVLGIILCCTGVGVGLGIGLILAGAAGITGAVAFNWNAIVDWVKDAWDGVKSFWHEHIAPIFTAAWWLNLAKKAGNGLISGFESAINGIITMFENMINWVVKGLNSISFDVPDWVPGIGGSTFGFNIPEVKFNRVSIPRLAKGAVIPANKEFLAILGDQKHGTNIEAPLSTIEEAVENVLNRMGMGGSSEVVKEEIYNLSETELMRIIYKLVKGGERLQGERLVKA